MKSTNNHFYGRRDELPSKMKPGSTFIATDTKEHFYYGFERLPVKQNNVEDAQGYLGLLTPFYFDGEATSTIIDGDDVGEFIEVNLNLDPNGGVVDQRPTSMKDAQPLGFEGSGTQADPYVLLLEGLDIHSFGKFRAIFDFDPDIDEGQLIARLNIERHSGSAIIGDFPIETSLSVMSQGADIDYPSSVDLSFFVGDTIDTFGPGDAGKIRLQIRSTVSGEIKLREIALYLNK